MQVMSLTIWRINLSSQKLSIEQPPDHWMKLGGRGLLAQIMVDETPATCEPLGPLNKLIFAPGLLVGHMLSSCDRISIGAKSPLTGGIKESNAGGSTGLLMALLGIKALIIEGQLVDPWWTMVLSVDGANFERADDIAGAGVSAAASNLLQRHGEKVGVSVIGPAGEMKLSAAGIQNLDKDKAPSRIAARGGLGAVMGSKGLKAIVFNSRGAIKPAVADINAFRDAQKRFTQSLLEQPQTKIYKEYGTAAMTRMCNSFGALPTRNFSAGTFEGVETISGEYLRQVIIDRGGDGKPSHACMAGCIIQCSNNYANSDGVSMVTPIEYETIGLMGSNLGIDSLDTIAILNSEVNDLGLDSIEIGAALGVAAEAGLLKFGDGEGALRLLNEIKAGTPLGRIIGNGAVSVGKMFGITRVPAVKGQAMSAYEPRAIKGTGVTYATSPQGADHTSGLTIRAKVNHLEPKGQADLSRAAQINMAGYDTLGACIFAGSGFAAAMDTIRDLLNARYGWNVDLDILQVLGKLSLNLERQFNINAGFTKQHDRLPEYMRYENLPPFNTVFDVTDEDLDNVFNW